MAYDYINFSCTLSSVYDTPGLYATLTACENAVNDGSAKPVLILNPLWSATKKASLPLSINKLGDGYQQTIFQGVDQISEEWSITSPILIGSQVDGLLNQLRNLAAASFLWSPNNGVIPYQEFTCDEWQTNKTGVGTYQISTKFQLITGLSSSPEPPSLVRTCISYNVVVLWYYANDLTNGRTTNGYLLGEIGGARGINEGGDSRLQVLCYGSYYEGLCSTDPIWVDIASPIPIPNVFGSPQIYSITPL